MPTKYVKKKNQNPDDEFEELLKKWEDKPEEEKYNYPDWSGMNLYTWSQLNRKIVEGRERKFIPPVWRDIYLDEAFFQMLVGGRQIFKSTFFGDCLGHQATSKKGSTGVYVTYNDESLSAFSTDKYRHGVLDVNPELKKFVMGSTLGQVHRVGYVNFAKTYLVTDEGKFHHVEGKSPDLMIIDEGQYIDFQHWVKMRESMATTQGKIKIGGIGGEEGSSYHNLWRSTNQMEFKFKYGELWRKKLVFDKNGLVLGDYLLDYADGNWVPRHPENKRNGYWLPQTIFWHIPMTVKSAIEDYKHPDGEFSIEYKMDIYPRTDFMNHVMGEFYVGTKRPLTEDMVYACIKPYTYLGFMTPQDVWELKTIFGNDIAVFMGVDFGSGNTGAAKTVVSVIIKWRARPEHGIPVPRYQLAYMKSNFSMDDDERAEEITKIARDYKIDLGVGDLGYGEHIVKKIQHGGLSPKTAEPYEGVGTRHFRGCWTRQDPVQVLKFNKEERDETGRKPTHYTIDKTHSIQTFVDFIKRYVTHPKYRSTYWEPGEMHINNSEFKYARSQFIIPSEMGKAQRETIGLVKEFTSITRLDIKEDEIAEEDKRQKARMEFNHPPDSVMSVIYAMVADEKYEVNPYEVLGVKKKI